MEPTKINELQEQRASHVARMREILNAADAETRSLTAEEQQEYDRLESDVDAKGARIKTEQKQRSLEDNLETRDGFDPREALGERGSDKADAQVRTAFNEYLRKGGLEISAETRGIMSEYRDQAKGTSNLGGYLVPTDFQRRLRMHALQAGTMRRTRVEVLVTGTGEALQIPKTTVHGSASWVAEAATSSGSDETFGQVTFNAYTVRRLVKVSVELVEDNAVDLIGYLSKEIGRSIGSLENGAYLNGTGTTQPTGLVGLASSGKVGLTGQTTAITTDDIMDLYFAVQPQYRNQAEWMMHDSTIKAVRKLKDSTGQFIWQITPGLGAGLKEGTPETLLGRPIFDDPDMPVMAANAKSVLFGDFSAYMIRDVGQNGPEAEERPMGAFSVIRLNERFMDGLQIGFLGYHRTDGNITDATGAVKFYANSAT